MTTIRETLRPLVATRGRRWGVGLALVVLWVMWMEHGGKIQAAVSGAPLSIVASCEHDVAEIRAYWQRLGRTSPSGYAEQPARMMDECLLAGLRLRR